MKSKSLDRKAIRSLRVGIVPSTHVLNLSVGLDSLSNFLRNEIDSLPGSKQKSYIVCGDWGTGKSNLLSYLREFALSRNTAVSYINLNGRATAVNHPQRFYHHIVSDLRFKEIATKGLIGLLLEKLTDHSFFNASKNWISINRHSSELAKALESLLNGKLGEAFPIILGTDLVWSDYGYKKEKAIKRIDDLGSYLKMVGFNGLTVQFDELETIDQLWNSRSRKSAYKFLFELTSFKNVWSVFATTERFNHRLLLDKHYGVCNEGTALKFAENYFRLPMVKPPAFDSKLASELLRRIEQLYRSVYSIAQEASLQQQVLEKWSLMPFKNPRRLIRLAIDHLDRHRPISWLND